MSKLNLLILLAVIVCIGLIAIVILQIPTFFTAPVTDAVKSYTGLDMALAKDKIIGALTGVSALSVGGIATLAYGFWSRGKQLTSEISSKLQWKSQATEAGNYATALADKQDQTKTVLDKVTAEKEQISTQYTAAKDKLSTYEQQIHDQEAVLKAKAQEEAAKWQSALPTNKVFVNPANPAEKFTVVEKVKVL